jgi:hypothetical protein
VKDRSIEEVKELREVIADRYKLDFPDPVLEPVWWGRRPTNRIDDRFAIVDQKTDNVFNICSDIYKPVYHEEIISIVEETAATLPEFGESKIKVSLLANGAKLRVHVVFPEVIHEIKLNDVVNPTIDVFSSYDLGWKLGGKFGAYRLVCTNGLTVGEIFDSFKKRHMISLDPEELAKTMLNGMNKFSDQTALWSKWAEERINKITYDTLWEELPFTKSEREKIEQIKEVATGATLKPALESGELTRWSYYNTITQYITHNITSELRQIDVLPVVTKIFERN